jgi:hypothetical protein
MASVEDDQSSVLAALVREPWPVVVDVAGWAVLVTWIVVLPAAMVVGSGYGFGPLFWSVNLCAVGVIGLAVLRAWPPGRVLRAAAIATVAAAALDIISVALAWTGLPTPVAASNVIGGGGCLLLVAVASRQLFASRKMRWMGYVLALGWALSELGWIFDSGGVFALGLFGLILMPLWMRKVAGRVLQAERQLGHGGYAGTSAPGTASP